MANPIRSMVLNNGLKANFYDRTNRYFGDFHRVVVLLKIQIPSNCLEGNAYDPTELVYEKQLERMGVAGKDIESSIEQLIDSFLATNGQYLSKSDFPKRYLQKKQRESERRNSHRDKKPI